MIAKKQRFILRFLLVVAITLFIQYYLPVSALILGMAIRFDCRRACLGAYRRFYLTLENNCQDKLNKRKFISLENKPPVKSDFYKSTHSKFVKRSSVQIRGL